EIDLKLLELINDRVKTAGEIGADKAARGEEVYRPEREAQVFRRLIERNPGPICDEAVRAIFGEIVSCARSAEAPMRVATLGPRGTFSEQAVYKVFGKQITLLEATSIEEVFRLTESGDAQFGVVPVENSTEGGVSATLDLLMETSLQICNEVELRVNHCLLANVAAQTPREIAGHEQALAQCRNWLATHFAGVTLTPTSSNAEAARAAADDPGVLAIASSEAAMLYGLEVQTRDIADVSGNTTRFQVLSRSSTPPSGNDKTSLVTASSDHAGSLLQLLEPLARAGISMTRIESRPTRSGLWKYVFFIDLEGHIADTKVEEALSEIERASAFLRILGSYPRAS
ncbi:MAG TPA: prephenate dehydratase, partial [Gammaproteobacteria bacterium]|nr:prephenate dehydratase [Gammaproteobacteria bacterium]